MVVQQCAWPGCAAQAAYRTRSKPAWCVEHITALLREGGVEPLEPFAGPTAWRLTRCLECRCEAHYRFVYTLDKNAAGEATCRACYWRGWAAQQRGRLAGVDFRQTETVDGVRALAETHGYEYLGPLTDPVCVDDPHRVRCRYCGRISAERTSDISFGCSCQSNPRRSRMTKPVIALLRDSESPASEWWDHERNPVDLWATATERTRRVAWWRCPECSLHFKAKVADMFALAGCPDCTERQRAEWGAEYERAKVTPVVAYPELVAAWADDRDPATVMVAGSWLHRFRCASGHYARLSPHTYLANGCPTCRGQDTRAVNAGARAEAVAEGRYLDGLTMNPEIAGQWHPDRNGSLRPSDRSPGSRRVVWWREASCGHEWQASPAEREEAQRLRCPVCRTILDSLAYHYPGLAAQWSPGNPRSAWEVRPSAVLSFVPEWVCPDDPAHRWRSAAAVRVNGSDCPMCRESGKSRVELLYFQAVRSAFDEAFSGLAMRNQAFTRRSVWVPDMTVHLPDGRTLLVEYDGSYWHAEKGAVDLDKSRDLLAAGSLVVRLRETPLPTLGLSDPGYLELTVYPTLPEPRRVVESIREWLAARPVAPRR